MILSLFISLVLCFRDMMLVAGMGYVEDELSPVIFTKILLIAVLESF